jgi:hypothetical protein
MDEDVQKELILVSKEALTCLSTGRRDEDLLYRLRDTIRKAEGKFGTDSQRVHRGPDDVHRT